MKSRQRQSITHSRYADTPTNNQRDGQYLDGKKGHIGAGYKQLNVEKMGKK